jgi:hypothetical protein
MICLMLKIFHAVTKVYFRIEQGQLLSLKH